MLEGSSITGQQRFPLTGRFLAGRVRDSLSVEDLDYVENLVESTRELKDRETLIHRGAAVDVSAILIDGFMFRTSHSGGRRFIVGVHVPGDFVDLHSFALKRLDHNVVAAGPAKVGLVSHRSLERALHERPTLSRALWFATLLDAAIHRKWIQILENLAAPRRIAHLYSEIQERLSLVGRAGSNALRTPFTQIDLADMCGISAVHANRAISRLRELGLAEIRRGTLLAPDWDALRNYAQFDKSYLYSDADADADAQADKVVDYR